MVSEHQEETSEVREDGERERDVRPMDQKTTIGEYKKGKGSLEKRRAEVAHFESVRSVLWCFVAS